jgi:cellobiose-specific phosphotransferase system component IIA
MAANIQTSIVTTAVTAMLFGASILAMANNVSPFAFASSSAATTGNGAAKMHLGEAMKALEAGDTAGAEMHMGEADKVLSEGSAKMHLGEAMKALQAGDTAGAKMHAQVAQDSL